MKRNIYSIVLLICFLAFSTVALAQLDSRQRTTETIVADGLAQLPAQTPAVYNQVINELAGTGSEGLQMIINMLTPADKGKNAAFEYAINGIVNNATLPGNETYREGVRKALINGLAACTDNANKAFLMTELQKCATAADASVFEKYLSDSYLSSFAANGLKAIPGIDNEIVNLMKSEAAPKDVLADIVSFRNIKSAAVEPILLSWVKSADSNTLSAIYNALSVAGSTKSLKILKAAAQNAVYPSNAMNSYLGLLNNLSADGQTKTVLKEAKNLLKNDNNSVKDAALQLLMKTDKANAASYVMSALAGDNKDLRNAALSYATSYADNNIYDVVVAKLPTLSTDAQTDIISWLGNNHVSSQVDAVTGAIGSSDSNLASAAIRAAGVIGGQKALNALIGQLGGNNAGLASAALTAFNGNIGEGVINALNGNSATQTQALKLASARRMYDAYDKVTALLNSSDTSVKDAAYDALAGVVKPNNFDALCGLLEKAEGNQVSKVQAAAMNAIKALSADEQYNLINSQMHQTHNEPLYYPLLGQAGNSDAIEKLLNAYNSGNKATALQSLLQVNNPEMIDVLYNLAKNESSTTKDNILSRYLTLASASSKNSLQKYNLYSQALALNPSATVQNKLIDALGTTRTLQALMLVSKYLDNKATSVQAAYAVKDILGKNTDLLGGAPVKQMLTKAQTILRGEQDADAGYAVDEISGLLAKMAPEGYEEVVVSTVTSKKPFKSEKQYENVEFYVEWKTDGDAILSVRSMPLIDLCANEGAALKNAATVGHNGKPGEWNSLYVKALNDRIFVEANGEIVAKNAIIINTPATKPLNTKGLIEIATKKENVELRNLYVHELPSTPVFTLSDEEKKEGFEVLFDGRSLEKWQGNLTDYVPEDGNIYVSANYGGTGNLYTKEKYSDFVYRFEFCYAVEGVNNGIGIRTNIGTDAAYDGMEIQILDHDAAIYKGLRDYQQHGAVYGIIVPKHVDFGPLNTWYKEEIRAVGDHITVTVNGEVILDGNIREACQGHNVAPDGAETNPYTVDHKNHPGLFNKDGYISFCGHGAGVKFRNVRILDLSKKK